MRVKLQSHSLLIIKQLVLSIILSTGVLISASANAEVINIPIQRTVATQPVISLEIIAIVKTLLNGRILSIEKQSSYSNPDCHQVKLLGDKGEFQIIRLGCYTDVVAQTKQE